ncbi:hypothetical protein BD779DRAFT_1666694 [Infundibulicybe gibba]|nr:hypothetical protein BD779DRAFT_1666694 [Infundibulicybe gibba]
MAELANVRAQIKTWERNFKAENGRDPTIQDIKNQPAVAEKYKHYKTLSKAAAAGGTPVIASSATVQPTTPPRSSARQYRAPLLLSTTRVLETTAPLTGFNPFSPQKNKGKQRASPPRSLQTRTNPFASPAKANPRDQMKRNLSPDPFPQIQPLPLIVPNPAASPPTPVTAVSRARKRLRGEPVSPSPSKEKRRRVGSHVLTPLPRVNLDAAPSSDDDIMADASVEDSPVKPPVGGKSFKLLFEENTAPIPSLELSARVGLARTKSKANARLFGETLHLEKDLGRVIGTGTQKRKREERVIQSLGGHTLGQIPDHTSTSGQETTSPSSTTKPDPTCGVSVSTSSALLPPSPPAAGSSYHAKPVLKLQREKAKAPLTGGDGSENGDESDEMELSGVKLVDRLTTRSDHIAEESELALDFDPILAYSLRGLPHGDQLAHPPLPDLGAEDMETFEVKLPEKFRQMLALETDESKKRHAQEDRLVEGLIYGRRTTHYDPLKGGEIWDAGDAEDDIKRDIEGEDDWEGEPIPWEVGEL